MHELRSALRSLLRQPGFTATIVLTLGLAVGVNTVIFSVVNAVLLRPLPYPEPDRLVRIDTQYFSFKQERNAVSRPEYMELRRDARSFQSLAAWTDGTSTFGDLARPVRVSAAYTTAGLAETMGVRPALGRYFNTEEDVPGDPRAVVLAHDLWQRAFGADPQVIGRRVMMDGYTVTVVGVMPAGFDFPDAETEAWVPLGLDPGDLATNRANHFLRVVGRLRPLVTFGAARAELADLTRRGQLLDAPNWHGFSADEHPLVANGLKDEIVGSTRTPLFLLQAAVLFILLIACANIGNLFLVRAEARARELAVRTALGAGRWQLMRLFLIESLACGVAGGALGVLLAMWGIDGVARLIPAGAPRAGEISIDGWVLGFGLACTLLAALAVGLAPIFHTRAVNLHARLSEGGRTLTGRSRLRQVLVVGEVAAAVVLALGCGLMVKSFHRLTHVDLGFRPEGLLSFELELLPNRYATSEDKLAFWDRLQRDVGEVPGVTGVTLSSQLPTSTRPPQNVVWYPGAIPYNMKGSPIAEWHIISDRYFETMGARLIRGRFPAPTDRQVVVLNASAARHFFPGTDPIGQTMRIAPWRQDPTTQTVIGVIGDVKQHGAAPPAGDGVYILLRDMPASVGGVPATLRVVVRAAAAPATLAAAVEAAVRRIDPTLPLSKVRTLDRVLWESVARPRFLTLLMLLFAGLAVLLAAIGVYGVMAYSVEQRTRELAIRVALGARPATVQGLVLRQSLRLAGVGIASGLIVALAMSVVLSAVFAEVLFETRSLDPLVFGVVSSLMLAIAVLAAWVPSRRAVRVDPMVSLRSE